MGREKLGEKERKVVPHRNQIIPKKITCRPKRPKAFTRELVWEAPGRWAGDAEGKEKGVRANQKKYTELLSIVDGGGREEESKRRHLGLYP